MSEQSQLLPFKKLSEQLNPADLIALLNRYMGKMVDVIVSFGGMVNKFGGDSLLAVLGTPRNPLPQHAATGIRAALGMRSVLFEFNEGQVM